MTQYVQSVQQFSITIGSGATSNTATISAVDPAKAFILLQGQTTTETAALRSAFARVALTDGTTITATRNTSSTSTVTVRGVVIELTSAAVASSVQTGTISMGGGASSNTATISAVGSNAFVVHLGSTCTTSLGTTFEQACVGLALTNFTTVTATRGSTNNSVVVGYAVIDVVAGTGFLNSAPQPRSLTLATTATSVTDTISPVDPNNSLLIDNGLYTPGSASRTNHLYTRELTNGTTVTLTRIGTGAATKTLLYTVLEFAAGVLNSAVQRGTTALTASPTDSTITSISTTRGAVNFAGMRTGSASLDATFSAVTLLNATAVRNYSDAATVSNLNAWEAFEFVRPPATFNDTISEGLTLADSLSAAALFAFSVAESVVTADALASAATFACVLSEVTACQDSLVAALQIAVVLAEQLTLADDMAFVFAALLVFFLDPKDLFNITGLSRPSPTGPAVLVLEDGGKLVTELGDSIQLK